jgi:hypothetical protein
MKKQTRNLISVTALALLMGSANAGVLGGTLTHIGLVALAGAAIKHECHLVADAQTNANHVQCGKKSQSQATPQGDKTAANP